LTVCVKARLFKRSHLSKKSIWEVITRHH